MSDTKVNNEMIEDSGKVSSGQIKPNSISSDDIFVIAQNFTSNEDMTTSGECTFMNMLDTDFQGSCCLLYTSPSPRD